LSKTRNENEKKHNREEREQTKNLGKKKGLLFCQRLLVQQRTALFEDSFDFLRNDQKWCFGGGDFNKFFFFRESERERVRS
jgi:hypothetical protein